MAGRRRSILKTVFGTSLLVTLAPFLSWGGYLYRQEAASGRIRQRLINLKDFPPNSKLTFPFPATGDPMVDSDPFRQCILIHLPNGQLRAYSKVCVHLWCLYDYFTNKGELQCPCHGTVYNADTGVAVNGPASLQPYPTNSLPEITLEVDADGTIYATGIKGRVGYGREYKSEVAWLQQRLSTSPTTPVTAYTPFRDPLKPDELQDLARRNDVQIAKWYGFVDASGREREWLTGTAADVSRPTGIYSAELTATPDKLLKLMEDKRVILLMPRT
jgi:rieske iron-sulfur protein